MAQLSPYTMQIKELAITELHEYENNPRNNDGAVDAFAASIEEFGFKVPIIIDSENIIVAGHTRLKAAKKLGLDTVPCIVKETSMKRNISKTQCYLTVLYVAAFLISNVLAAKQFLLPFGITKKVAAQEAKADVA